MGVRIKLDSMNTVEEPTLILATRKGRKLGSIPTYNIVFKDCLNSYSEISFRVSKIDNNNECLLWDEITDFKLLWCKEYDLWFEIYVEIDETNELIKNVIGKSVCEAELSQINLYGIEINTEDDIAREDYEKPTVFFDEEYPENSLLNRLMEKAPHYTIIHVDSTLADIQKTFSFDDKSIYDAFQEIAEEVGCIFIFGSNSTPSGGIARTIAVYDLQSNCNNCGHRREFTDVCPECGSTSIKYGYGNDTGIFVSSESLAKNITYTTDTDSVKNCFKLEAGDDLMNATIRNCNPNGTDYIWHISDNVKNDMSETLVGRLEEYDELYEECQNDRRISLNSTAVSRFNALVNTYNSYRAENEKFNRISNSIIGFPNLMTAYYDTIDLKLFLQAGLMPSFDIEETTATDQVNLLTQDRLSPVAVISTSSLSKTIAENAVLGLAKIYINPSYTVKVKNSSLSGKRWTGNFTVTNLYDETDYADSRSITVTINDDVQTYLEQKVSKALNSRDTDKYSITGVFSLDYDDFCEEIKRYSLDCLTSFHDACQAVLDILTEQSSTSEVVCNTCGFSGQYKKSYSRICPDCGNALSGVYTELYYPYWQKLKALQSEIADRESEIKYIENLQDYIISARDNIQEELDFEEFMGETLWKEFCAYRRESKFSNANYISDGLNNVELFSRALEFIQAANLEIYKSSELQHSITSTLNNLLVMEEFQPLISKFEVGNWLRMQVDDEVYKLRLLEYEIDYDNLDNINVIFSDVVRVSGGYSDIESILKQASSMATSYDTIAHQASQGDKNNKRVSQWVEKGLALTNSFISDSDNQEVVLDSHGFTMKEYLPITDNYSDKQLKIINKGLYVTDDDWETSRAGIGNFVYYDPRDGRVKEAYGVIADTLIGNLILGENVGIYNKNNSITLDENGFNMEESHGSITTSFNINLNPLQPNEDFLSIRKNSTAIFKVDKSGNAYFNGDITGASGNFSGTLSIGEDTDGDPVFIVDENGNVVMNGGITLGGSISWGDNSSPEEIAKSAVSDLRYSLIRTLYYPKTTNQPSKPNKDYDTYSNTSSSTWHKSFNNTTDRWLSRSFDGGQTWQNVEAITALTHIDATGIYTGTLVADNIIGGHISTATFTNSDTSNNYGYMDLYKQMILFNENDSGSTKGDTKMAIGFLKGTQYNEPIIVMGAGDGNGSNVGYINKGSDNFSMYYKVNNSNLSYIKMYNNSGKASIRINGIEFPQQDNDDVVYDFMKKADDWNNKLEAIKSDFRTNNKIVTDGSGNALSISPENLSEIFTIDKEKGIIYLRPDVVLSWNAVYALYAETNLSKPTDVYSSYSDSSSTTWHKIANTTYDYYVSYSYDGGKTWSNAIQMKGKNGEDGADGKNGKDGKDGVIDYSTINTILQNTYNITSTEIGKSRISSPTIMSAELYSPNIYGENLTLLTENKSNKKIYNSMKLTPTSMSLTNSYGGNASTKFYLDLGQDSANSTIKMRLGAGTNDVGTQALNIEKYQDEIRVGTYVNSSGSRLTDFAGMIIKPSTGEVTFTGTVQAVAVFG